MDKMCPVILIVDDHPTYRQSLLDWLVLFLPDSKIIEAESGQDALNKIAQETPDVVIMDISMPDMDGIEATRQIRALFADLPVILLTLQSAKEYEKDASRAGANAFVAKNKMHSRLIPTLQLMLDSTESPKLI